MKKYRGEEEEREVLFGGVEAWGWGVLGKGVAELTSTRSRFSSVSRLGKSRTEALRTSFVLGG